jgi:hypothetical protein
LVDQKRKGKDFAKKKSVKQENVEKEKAGLDKPTDG